MTESEFIEMIHGSVDDDWYLDEAEDKNLLQHATANGMQAQRAHALVDRVCDEVGAAREKTLLEELRRMLEQRTRDDKFLDEGEEAECLALCEPAAGKQKGLDESKAQSFVASFCETRGYGRGKLKRQQAASAGTGGRQNVGMLVGVGAAAVLALAGYGIYRVSAPSIVVERVVAATPSANIREPADAAALSADIVANIAQPPPPTQPAEPVQPPPLSKMASERRQRFESLLIDGDDALLKKKLTTPADGSVLFFISSYSAEIRASDRNTTDFKDLEKHRSQLCKGAVDYYCTRYEDEHHDRKWKERATVMAGTCQDSEILSPCFVSDK